MSDQVGNPEDRISHDAAHLIPISCGFHELMISGDLKVCFK